MGDAGENGRGPLTDRLLAAGMDGYIAKPIHAEELYRLLEQTTADTAPVPGV